MEEEQPGSASASHSLRCLHLFVCKTVEAAKAEADHVINTLKGFSPTYPVYFDLEEKSLESTSNRMLLANMAKRLLRQDRGSRLYSRNLREHELVEQLFD